MGLLVCFNNSQWIFFVSIILIYFNNSPWKPPSTFFFLGKYIIYCFQTKHFLFNRWFNVYGELQSRDKYWKKKIPIKNLRTKQKKTKKEIQRQRALQKKKKKSKKEQKRKYKKRKRSKFKRTGVYRKLEKMICKIYKYESFFWDRW